MYGYNERNSRPANLSFDNLEYNLGNIGLGIDNLGSALGLSRTDKNKLRFWTSQVPVVGDMIRAQDSWNRANDYLRNRGLSWNDVRYGMPQSGTASSALTNGVAFVSRNILSLYR